MAASRRALHFVFKVADRTSTAAFYRDVLGMKVTTDSQIGSRLFQVTY